MEDYAAQRTAMINSQIRTDHVTDKALLDALAKTPREAFAPENRQAFVYADCETQIDEGRALMRPCSFARLVEALDIKPTDLVLDIACGLGYSTAIFSHLAEMVIALEDDATRVERASHILANLGLDNNAVIEGKLENSLPEHGPFDAIFVNGAVERVPEAWLELLSQEHGRLAVIVHQKTYGEARLYIRSGHHTSYRTLFETRSQMLPGFEKKPGFVF